MQEASGNNVMKNTEDISNPSVMDTLEVATGNPAETGDKTNEISQNATTISTSSQSSSVCPNEKRRAPVDENIDLQVEPSSISHQEVKAGVEAPEQKTANSDYSTNSVTDELRGPVPNFRLEGSGAGDSSITVAVAGLTSAVPLSNERNNEDGPGSGSGPVSVQSSEEMKLSLVSWYSEPDDPSRAIVSSTSSCCGESGLTFQNGRQAISMTGSLLSKSGSEEKENRTPEPDTASQVLGNSRETVLTFANGEHDETKGDNKQSQRIKMHVQLPEQKATPTCPNKKSGVCEAGSRNGRPECPRCSRRSKSGSTTPATGMHQQSRSRIPANRRLIPSSKSSTELKRPIKSILKNDSRGSGGSGSGSDNKSSMDSLGSADIRVMPTPIRQPGSIMTRSDSGTRAKFNLNHKIYNDTPRSAPEDKMVSKLRRIEKHATLRLRKPARVRPLDLSDTDIEYSSSGGSKVWTPGCAVQNDLMTKSMSFLEKSSLRGEHVSLPYGAPHSASNSLKRQGSLRTKKPSPQWEPCTTRTTALRMQKMQEAKAKSGGSVYSHGTGSTHFGSGESIHHLANSGASHHQHAHSAPSGKSHTTQKEQKNVKVFTKLSSAFGQTASSNQKRLRQEKASQTESNVGGEHSTAGTSLSPIPSVDAAADLAEQIRQLEKLANRYRNTALRFQSEYEKSEARKVQLAKQLQEAQTESSEMIEFLQAEKSTLAETLAEIETEAKTWREQIQLIQTESQSRCSSLVRLSEQHKQEALKSQTLLTRLESQSNSMISSLSSQICGGTTSISLIRQKVNSLTESLLTAYKIPQELLTSFKDTNPESRVSGGESEMNTSLLLPLITTIATEFPASLIDTNTRCMKASNVPPQLSNNSTSANVANKLSKVENKSTGTTMMGSSSLQNLNQAILDREAAENIGLDDITLCPSDDLGTDDDHLSFAHEISELNSAIGRLLLVVRVIVVHCDKRVSTVASSILQCLQSMEDDKVGNIPEIAQVQKSLEAWRDNTENSHNETSPCKSFANDMSPTSHVGHTSSA